MVTRTNELKKLDAIYQSNDNNLVLMYGRTGSAKESLLDSFTTGKSYFYYRSRQCSDEKQLFYLDKQMRETYNYLKASQSFEECFKNYRSKDGSKLVIIIDEAQFAIKKQTELFYALVSLKNHKLLIFMDTNLAMCSFMSHAFGDLYKKALPNSKPQFYLPCFHV